MNEKRRPTLRAILVAAVLALGTTGCGSGDNTGAVKAHAGIKPGMFIWDAFTHADESQFPDIRFMAWGKECSHPGVDVGRDSGPLYLKVRRQEMDPKYPVSGNAYTQEGFASREAFIAAVKTRTSLFSSCKAVVFFMGRYQGWPAADAFDVTVDSSGHITAVTPLREVRD